ncbi:glycoside hydrolase [Anoxybacter fermentans]|uniref:Glycoside hydrolase n=1 Tax=Anoxybacter fermentans TaxID=1323375 RepID=A0A3Q9HQC3_9FIRM|nr:1,4-alpha-glucan branching protein domain-containing protein [Anoxybacter fermentans]AZR72249.1 glycoside hydrolase [Anoxybacter fermentans]
MTQGYLNLVLHAHLPFVRHPNDSDPLEEDWFYEAITETYLPLLKMMEQLERENVPFPITIVLSPTLLNMLNDKLLKTRYLRRLERLIELAQKEVKRTQNEPEFNRVAQMYLDSFKKVYHLFCERYEKNIIQGFRYFQEIGQIEIITCAATHGYLPLMIYPESIRAQIRQGIRTYERFFGRKPRGIWLPECGYKPGFDQILADEGIEFFFVDTHCLLYATPRPKYGVNAPVYTPAGVAVFGRDVETSKQVWSAQEGYPGDFDYREFYRDIGYDLDYNYIRPYIHSSGIRKMTGIKYYRITGKTDYKKVYKPDWARKKASIHASNFIFNRQKQIEYLTTFMDKPPIINAPYDAELFGHWWYEGPQFLEFVIKKLYFDQNQVRLITPSRYLEKYPNHQIAQPSEGSWGHEGYHEVWLNGTNDWIYPYLHQASRQMIDLASEYKNPSLLELRALNQAARELLLAQSSDWAFIMKTGTMVDYAIRRIKTHLNQFNEIVKMIREKRIDEEKLSRFEAENNLFPELDYRIYQHI